MLPQKFGICTTAYRATITLGFATLSSNKITNNKATSHTRTRTTKQSQQLFGLDLSCRDAKHKRLLSSLPFYRLLHGLHWMTSMIQRYRKTKARLSLNSDRDCLKIDNLSTVFEYCKWILVLD